MRVVVYPSDRTGCGHYRILWPVEVLRAQGHEIAIRPDDPFDMTCDVFVIQRAMAQSLARLIPELRANGTAIVVDFDDDMEAIDPRSPGFGLLHPQRRADLNFNWAREICRQATLVTCSTPALAERYGGVVIRNYVPARFLEVDRTFNYAYAQPALGWAGSVQTHPDDLRATGNAIARLRYPFYVIGPGDGVAETLGIESVTASGWVPFEQWPGHVASLDVGIAPLADTRFNRAKSWLKPLEYSALGVAWVASETPEYRRLKHLGAGVTVRKPKAWLRELRRLLDDEGYRTEQARRAREVAAGLTIEQHAWRFWEAWAEALTLERGRRKTETRGAKTAPRETVSD